MRAALVHQILQQQHRTGNATAVIRKVAIANGVLSPAFCPKNGGKIRFPAPKKRENNIKLTSKICFFCSFIDNLLKIKKIALERTIEDRGTTLIPEKISAHIRII